MTSRARGTPAGRARASGSPSHGALVEKYAALCAKYEALVRRLHADTSERAGAVALALSAVRALPSALALATTDTVSYGNGAWAALMRTGELMAAAAPGSEGLPARAAPREIAQAGIERVLARGGPAVAESRYEDPTSAAVWSFRFERTVHAGKRVAFVMVSDVTDAVQRERDLEQARRRLTEQEHLRTVGLLAAGVAHDFSNALHAAMLHLSGLERSEGREDHAARSVEAMRRILTGLGVRARRVLKLSYERHELTFEPTSIAQVVETAAELSRSELRSGQGCSAEVQVAPGLDALPRVHGASPELEHLFMNLFLNARDAMPGGGIVRVSGRVEDDEVVVEVEDEGQGIPEADLPRVFEPFFSTKGDRGNGLGLATAYGLMRALGGAISARNRATGGAVFTLRFRPSP